MTSRKARQVREELWRKLSKARAGAARRASEGLICVYLNLDDLSYYSLQHSSLQTRAKTVFLANDGVESKIWVTSKIFYLEDNSISRTIRCFIGDPFYQRLTTPINITDLITDLKDGQDATTKTNSDQVSIKEQQRYRVYLSLCIPTGLNHSRINPYRKTRIITCRWRFFLRRSLISRNGSPTIKTYNSSPLKSITRPPKPVPTKTEQSIKLERRDLPDLPRVTAYFISRSTIVLEVVKNYLKESHGVNATVLVLVNG